MLSLGADDFIDYRTQAFEEVIQDADIVHDAVLSDDVRHVERSLRAIKPGGRLLSLIVDLDEGMQRKLREKNVTGARVFLRADQDDLESIAGLMAAGKLKTHVSRVFTLEQMPQAHALIQTKNAVGKIIVTVNN